MGICCVGQRPLVPRDQLEAQISQHAVTAALHREKAVTENRCLPDTQMWHQGCVQNFFLYVEEKLKLCL